MWYFLYYKFHLQFFINNFNEWNFSLILINFEGKVTFEIDSFIVWLILFDAEDGCVKSRNTFLFTFSILYKSIWVDGNIGLRKVKQGLRIRVFRLQFFIIWIGIHYFYSFKLFIIISWFYISIHIIQPNLTNPYVLI